jgi:hypothetical protein
MYFDTQTSKEERELKFTSFATILDVYADRPLPPKRNVDYSTIRHKKFVQRVSTIVSALSSKQGLIPFPEDDLQLLKQLFSNAIRG